MSQQRSGAVGPATQGLGRRHQGLGRTLGSAFFTHPRLAHARALLDGPQAGGALLQGRCHHHVGRDAHQAVQSIKAAGMAIGSCQQAGIAAMLRGARPAGPSREQLCYLQVGGESLCVLLVCTTSVNMQAVLSLQAGAVRAPRLGRVQRRVKAEAAENGAAATATLEKKVCIEGRRGCEGRAQAPGWVRPVVEGALPSLF